MIASVSTLREFSDGPEVSGRAQRVLRTTVQERTLHPTRFRNRIQIGYRNKVNAGVPHVAELEGGVAAEFSLNRHVPLPAVRGYVGWIDGCVGRHRRTAERRRGFQRPVVGSADHEGRRARQSFILSYRCPLVKLSQT